MNKNIVNEFKEILQYGVEHPLHVACCVSAGLITGAVVLSVQKLVKHLKENAHKKSTPESFKEYMIYGDACICEPSEDNPKIFNKVSGSIFKFLRGLEESKKFNDEELAELIMTYCKYVDITYGKDYKCVESNIGKDYAKLLAGELV